MEIIVIYMKNITPTLREFQEVFDDYCKYYDYYITSIHFKQKRKLIFLNYWKKQLKEKNELLLKKNEGKLFHPMSDFFEENE